MQLITRFFTCLFFVCAMQMSAVGLAAESVSVAMVTDIQGKTTVLDDTRKPELSILSEVKTKQRVQFSANARAVFVYLQSGQEFEVKGPAVIVFGELAPESTSGNKPQKKGVALAKSGKEIRIKPIVVAQAAIVMRSVNPSLKLKLLSPNGSKSLTAHPGFFWQALQPNLKYQFELLDDTGASLFASESANTQIELPATLGLKDDVVYTWVVSTKLENGKQYSNAGDFSIASAELRDEVAKLQPAADASLSERVLFATWLEQMELRDEARKHWKLAAAERQDDQRLKVLADE